MKLQNVSCLGALLLAVTGCAHSRSAVAYQPISNGQPVDLTSYDLTVGGRPGGSVAFLPATYVHQPRGERDLIIVPVRIDNNSDRAFRMPTAQLFLTTSTATQLPPVEVDGGAVPDAIVVPPGQSQSLHVAFAQPLPRDTRAQILVSWTLDIEGAQPIARVTPFAAYAPRFAEGNGAGAELPSLANAKKLGNESRSFDQSAITPQREFGQGTRARAFTPGAQ